MDRIFVEYKIVTPLVLGGAEPFDKAELRVPSIKGAMRFWYRAVDPDYKAHEGKIFGSTTHGQAAFSMRSTDNTSEKTIFKKDDYAEYNCKLDKYNRNGVIYMGFPLDTGSKEKGNLMQRRYIDPGKGEGKIIKLELLFKKRLEEESRRAIIVSLWLLGHVGGLGFRSRRGFGSIALMKIEQINGSPWPELETAHDADSCDKWLESFESGITRIKSWYTKDDISKPEASLPKGMVVDHTILHDGVFYLVKPKRECNKWEDAMDKAGRILQDFRSCRPPDYSCVKAHLVKKSGCEIDGIEPAYLTQSPERCQFGLPLTFQYSSLKQNKGCKSHSLTFQGVNHERSASPIFVRIIKIKDKFYPFFAWLKAPLLEDGEKIKDIKDKESKHPIEVTRTDLLRDFWADMQSKNDGMEVKW